MAKHKSQSWYLITVSKDSGNGFNSPVTTVTFFHTGFLQDYHFKPLDSDSKLIISHRTSSDRDFKQPFKDLH